MNIATKWNRLDQAIFCIENFFKEIYEKIRGTDPVPDVEIMIAAETEHLRIENEKYKQRETPGILLQHDYIYSCPSCRNEIPENILSNVKYCPECGKRVIKSIPFKCKEMSDSKDNG